MQVSFFDDDAETTQVKAPTPRPRRKRSRSRIRIQRLIIALVALFILVFVLALVVRSCQQNAKESTYRTYFTQVQQIITRSKNDVGKPIAALLADPTRYGKTQLQATLDKLVLTQSAITTDTKNIDPPGKLKNLHQILVQGQQVRLSGVEKVRDGLVAALTGKHLPATARKGMYTLTSMTPEERLRLWTGAIQKAGELWNDRWGLAYNGDDHRTQCQPHVHIGKLLEGEETKDFVVVDGPAQIPLPREDGGLWVHPQGGKLHVHLEELAEPVLMR